MLYVVIARRAIPTPIALPWVLVGFLKTEERKACMKPLHSITLSSVFCRRVESFRRHIMNNNSVNMTKSLSACPAPQNILARTSYMECLKISGNHFLAGGQQPRNSGRMAGVRYTQARPPLLSGQALYYGTPRPSRVAFASSLCASSSAYLL